MTERWRVIPGWPDYEVSDMGRVRSLPRSMVRANGRPYNKAARIMRGSIGMPDGYPVVTLSPKGTNRHAVLKIHRLVLLAFVGPAPEGMVTCHNDGNPTNNRLDNLRWDTPSANMVDRVKHGTDPEARKTHCKRGHPFDEKNTVWREGRRNCRECMNGLRRAKRARKRAAAAVVDVGDGDLIAVQRVDGAA